MKRRTAAWLVLLVMTLVCRGLYLDNVFYNVDEAEYAVAADAMTTGELPGADLLGSTKPPGISLLYLSLFEGFGRTLTAIHISEIALFLLLGVLVVEIGILLWGTAAAIPAAVLFWMIGNSFSLPSEMLALNVELPGMVFVVGALLFSLKTKRKSGWLLVGIMLGIAAIFRQSLIIFAIPSLFWWWSSKQREPSEPFALLVGISFPWVIVFVVYAVNGGLGQALDSWFRYPAVYASDVGFGGFFVAMGLNLSEFAAQCLFPLVIAIAGKVVLLRQESHREKLLVFSLAVVSFLALCSGSRFYGHYFYQIFPVIVLAGVPGWLWLCDAGKWFRGALTGIVVVGGAIALLHFPLWPYWDSAAPRDGIPVASLSPSKLERPLGNFVKENTTRNERIAVWGYCPQIYFYADRLPGVRDYLCHYATGFSAGSFDPWTQKPFRVTGYPGARKMYADDLHREQPIYFIDISGINHYQYTFHQLPLRDFPLIAETVESLYRLDRTLGPIKIWKLKSNT